MGKFQREKGKRGEREAAKELSRLLGIPVTRSQQFKGSPESADLAGVDGLHIEVKRTERLRLYKAIEQAAAESGGDCSIVLHRRNNKPWVAIVFLGDLSDVAGIINRI